MTPTFIGRIQTRLFLILVIGVPWTLLVGPFLPRSNPGNALSFGEQLRSVYEITFLALGLVALIGCVLWEPVYHALQQLRWEKDWPVLFFLVSSLHEGLLLWILLPKPTDGVADESTFFVHFAGAWLLMWLFVIGPIRLILVRYRFRGGRVL